MQYIFFAQPIIKNAVQYKGSLNKDVQFIKWNAFYTVSSETASN